MKIGIIVYSQTGNTLIVARKLEEKLAAAGHAVTVEQVTITGKPEAKFELADKPVIESYDALIFGAPVQAFSLAQVMKAYLEQLPSLDGKRAACFVTKQLPYNWTGGNRAVDRMKKICEAKGASVSGTAIVVWAKSRRDENIGRCLQVLGELFPG